MLSEDIKINDVIKVIPINIDYAKNAIHFIESSKYLKFIEHYEGKIIKGIPLKDDIDYLMKISKNMNSRYNTCICGYNPIDSKTWFIQNINEYKHT